MDIAAVFRNCVKAMTRGGGLVVVIHDSANLYPEIASMCGVEVVAVLDRHVNRRTSRRSSEFYESISIWRKPQKKWFAALKPRLGAFEAILP